MQEQGFYLAIAASSVAAIAIVSAAALRGWAGWLELKKSELLRFGEARADEGIPSMATRIEVADLKERIRKLEAIAAGVDL